MRRKTIPELQEVINVVSLVLPLRTNRYVMDQLIDWKQVPGDPVYQLTFSQKGMASSAQPRFPRLGR